MSAVHACHDALTIVFSNGAKIVAPPVLACLISTGDRIEVPGDLMSGGGSEIRIVRRTRRPLRQVYVCALQYVAAPKLDNRDEYCIRAEVADSQLGVASVRIPAAAVRDYFYTNARAGWGSGPTLYDVLRVSPSAEPAEIRLSYRVRKFEAELLGEPAASELRRAGNLLMHPDTRACYDALLRDADAPTVFPYSAIGRLVVAGELSGDRQMFFATQLLSFTPDSRTWRFHAPFRRIEFGHGQAVLRDPRRQVEIVFDPSAFPAPWHPTWNQWRHFVGAKLAIDGLFVRTPRYHLREGEWRLGDWWTALPAELSVASPPDLESQAADAQSVWNLLGRHTDALEGMRARIDRDPVDAEELSKLCRNIGLPGAFDVARISWKPDYDRVFYDQLRRRCRKLYLFRNEYIFDLVNAIVVEVPELGHATYVFQRPSSVEAFLRTYTTVTGRHPTEPEWGRRTVGICRKNPARPQSQILVQRTTAPRRRAR